MVYLDNSATTRPCAAAVAAAREAMETDWGNPSAIHTLGMAAARTLQTARRQVAQALGAETDRVVFTSGGTEADNWAIFSAAERLRKRGRHIVTTAVEHHAVLHPVQHLAQQGFEVTYLSPDADGRVSAEALQNALRPDTILVSVMLVNNESGAVMPIEQMAKLTHRVCPNAIFHTDAVQGLFHVPFRAQTLGADLLSVSAHKIHGLKGAGALYVRKGLTLPPYLHGGGQEGGYRSGTESIPAIAAFGAACAALQPTALADQRKMRRKSALLRERLSALPGVVLLGAGDAPHIVSLSVPGLRSQGLINCLQDEEVYVSAGSACAKGRRSHVLEAMGVAPELIDGAIRVSLSRETADEELECFLRALQNAVRRLSRS